MTRSSILTTAALALALLAVAGCGRKAPLITPYEAAVEARKDAERNKEPLPPEPTPPEKNKRFFLDALID